MYFSSVFIMIMNYSSVYLSIASRVIETDFKRHAQAEGSKKGVIDVIDRAGTPRDSTQE